LESQNKKILYELDRLKSELENANDKIHNLEKNNKRLNCLVKENEHKIEFFSRFDKLNAAIKDLIQNEITNGSREKNGRRYNDSIKMISLYTHLSSPKAYKILRNIFTLPSKQTLKKHISVDFKQTGLTDSMLEYLKSASFDRNFSLLLDEVHLCPELTFDSATGSIEGKADLCDIEAKNAPAKAVLTLMLRSSLSSFKIPIGFYLTHSSVNGNDLRSIIENAIIRLYEVNINVDVIISDQGPSNQLLAKNLKITEDNPSFVLKVKSEPDVYKRIYYVFDTPHIFKTLRNNFINYDLEFQANDGLKYIAKWKYIKEAFYIDTQNEISMFPKIKAKHFHPTNYQKMNVALALQVFSNSVSSAMKFLIDNKKLEAEAKGTQILVKLLNDLFDILNNNDTYEDSVLKEGNKAYQSLIRYLELLESFKFVDKNGKKVTRINCIKNLQTTIGSLLAYQKHIKINYGQEYILTRRFNQDALENLFSMLRYLAKENGQLRVTTFKTAFCSLIYCSSFNLNLSVNKNCIDDNDKFALFNITKSNMKENEDKFQFDFSNFNEEERFLSSDLIKDNNDLNNNELNDDIHYNVSVYITGFAIKKLSRFICSDCEIVLKADCFHKGLELTNAKETSPGKLIKPSIELSKFVQEFIRFFF
jgi:hypothetical protein